MLQTLTVQEYAQLKGVSHVTVYRWIEKNKVKYTVEQVEGKDVKKILVQNDELLSNEHVLTPVSNSVEHVSTEGKNSEIAVVLQDKDDKNDRYLQIIQSFQEQNNDLILDVKKYAEMAGQAKLLMDSEHRTKEEYFKVIQENAILKAQLEQLQEKMSQQEEENKHQGLMSFFSKL